MNISNKQLQELEAAARASVAYSYAPYSKFPVGAAVMTRNGKIFAGCNVENSSFGLSNCAERTAVFKAVAKGYREIVAVVVYTPTSRATLPCGACRQVINEFGPVAHIVCICDSDHRVETTLDALLPDAFGPHNLEQEVHHV